ncbi:hypothetical protein ARMSODRAFT_1003362 [Armillaria solidipes]|uniref:Uncharacterized protein n=1 Tax=Armillaria solidipes TaxID=1076256 RepID=A0A2H3BJ34_9AGAR|nr:hypothetical protein ARMSODRAFT_1003362 [Armillaria solidipes]
MATQTDIPSDLTDDFKVSLFQFLDAELNSTILYALLYGIYTGILVVTLWNIFINKCWPIRRAVVIVIILLHAVITINFAGNWSWLRFAFIENGQTFWTIYLILSHGEGTDAANWVMDITASISTILADLYMIWCCWMVWGRRWPVVLLSTFSLVAAIVSKIMIVYYSYINAVLTLVVLDMVYISFNLATTLSCTLLIIYRIVTVAGVRHGAVGRLRVYRRFIQVLVESSALYSISLILDLALTIRGDLRLYDLDIIAGIAKGVAPTLLVGRAAAGHTLPRDDSDGSTVSSLHFQTSSAHNTTSSQLEESTVQSSVLATDIEAQPERQVVSVEQDTMVSTRQADIVD